VIGRRLKCGRFPQGFGLDIGSIDHFTTQLIIIFDYSAIADFHSSEITRAHAKSFPVKVSRTIPPILVLYHTYYVREKVKIVTCLIPRA
jgi:hypothetical protein